ASSWPLPGGPRLIPIPDLSLTAPAVTPDGRLIAATWDRLLSVTRSGQVSTLLELDLPLAASPKVLPDGSMLLVQGKYRDYAEGGHRLTRLSPDGKPLWSVPVDRRTAEQPLEVSGDRVLCRRERKLDSIRSQEAVEAFRLEDGASLWRHDARYAAALPDGRVVLGDSGLQVVDRDGQVRPADLPDNSFVFGVHSDPEGNLWVRYSGRLVGYRPDGSVFSERDGYGWSMPVGRHGSTEFYVTDREVHGQDAATGELRWRLPASARECAVDAEGRLRFAEQQQLWSVDQDGGVTAQDLPQDFSVCGPPLVLEDGSTVLLGLKSLCVLPPPDPGRVDRSALDVMKDACARALGVEAGQLAHLTDPEFEAVRDRAVSLNQECWRLSERNQNQDDHKRFQSEREFFRTAMLDAGLSPQARFGVLNAHTLPGWLHYDAARLEAALGATDRDTLYRALPLLLDRDPARNREGMAAMPTGWLHTYCRASLGQAPRPGEDRVPPDGLSHRELAAAAQALQACQAVLMRMHGGSGLVDELLRSSLPPELRVEALELVGSAIKELEFNRSLAFVDRARRVVGREDLSDAVRLDVLKSLRSEEGTQDLEDLVRTARLLRSAAPPSAVVEAPRFVSFNGVRVRRRS
ncbi:MAG: PQQ-binding-like beta-propeller repeat protein, partial [Candidatus Eremiobacterota bacterium]